MKRFEQGGPTQSTRASTEKACEGERKKVQELKFVEADERGPDRRENIPCLAALAVKANRRVKRSAEIRKPGPIVSVDRR